MKILLAALLLAVVPAAASAREVRYTLQDVVFADGGTASGRFSYDEEANYPYFDFDITTTAGGAFDGMRYLGELFMYDNRGFGISDEDSGLALYAIDFSNLAVAGTYALNPAESYEVRDYYMTRQVVRGSFVAETVPEPSMLAMMGLGLAGIAVARRRPSPQ